MLIGFVGDVHGRVFHMLAALMTWQERSGRQFDLIVQVGDMGAFPDLRHIDTGTASGVYLTLDPSEGDFVRLLKPKGKLAPCLEQLRQQFRTPIYFICGNHDDRNWLTELLPPFQDVADVDPLGCLRYVRDGTLVTIDGIHIGFLGGDDWPGWEGNRDITAYERLMGLPRGGCDVLVTHDAPYGIPTGRDGRLQGSKSISALLASLQPEFHVSGHYHHMNGPRPEGPVTSLGLASLVALPSSTRTPTNCRPLQIPGSAIFRPRLTWRRDVRADDSGRFSAHERRAI